MSKTTFSILSRPDSYKSFILLLVFSFSLPVFLYAAEPTLKDVMENDAAFEGQSPDGDKQANETQPEKTLPAGPIDDLDRGVPRSSILGFAQVTEKGDFERAAEYLDLRHLPYRMNLFGYPTAAWIYFHRVA
jgi:hypothetical protein